MESVEEERVYTKEVRFVFHSAERFIMKTA
jgi:hypothetical protein